MTALKKILRIIPLEALTWSLALIALAQMPPDNGHFTVCPLALAGFEWCPGCGVGRAISLFFHGEFYRSFEMHPLGMFAVIVLISRTYTLIKTHISTYGKSY